MAEQVKIHGIVSNASHKPLAMIRVLAIQAGHEVERTYTSDDGSYSFAVPKGLTTLSFDTPSARKMRRAAEMLFDSKVDFEVDGEMHADAALDPAQRQRRLPHSRIEGQANVLIFPSLDAANIAYESSRVLANALPVGPILVGAARPVHVVTASTTARGIVNMTAVAVVEAQAEVRDLAAQ